MNYTRSLSLDEPDWASVITRKAPYYAYEQEVRCFVLLDRDAPEKVEQRSALSEEWLIPPPPAAPPPPRGRHIRVDVDELVQELYLSPFGGEWSKDVLIGLLQAMAPHLADRVSESSIRDV
jgi:hypothetical protein